MNHRQQVLLRIVSVLREVAPEKANAIQPGTSLLTDVDLDSLRTLELIERIRDEFGVDLLSPPNSMTDLATPETIIDAIMAAWQRRDDNDTDLPMALEP